MNRLFLLLPLALVACTADSSELDTSSNASPLTKVKGPWIRPYYGDLEIDAMGADGSDVYSGGYFVGEATFDQEHVVTSANTIRGVPTKDAFVARHTANGDLAWVKTIGGPGLEGNVYDLVARGGTMYASGSFSGDVTLDGIRLRSTVEGGSGSDSSGTYGNMMLAAFGANGRTRWAIQSRGDVVSGGNEVALDDEGALLQIGMFGGTADAGGTFRLGREARDFTGGFFDTYAAKLEPDGSLDWLVTIGGDGAQRGKAIASDRRGDVLVAGDAWDGETRFGPRAAFTTKSKQAKQDFWVAKYDSRGALLWWRSFASTGADEVKGIGTDADGNVIVGASFEGPSLDLGGGTTVNALPNAARTGIVFALRPSGDRVVWSTTFASVEKCCELEVDDRGHTFASGGARGPSVTYDNGDVFPLGPGRRGGLLTEFGPRGRRLASWTVDGEDAELGELALGANRTIAVAGSFRGAKVSAFGVEAKGRGGRTQFVLSFPQ